jgi:perosamine synthetase
MPKDSYQVGYLLMFEKMKMINHSMPTLDEMEISALSEILRSRHIATGEEVAKFEKETAEYCEVAGAVACSSGTAALHLALIALGIGKDMEIIIPSFCCASLYQAVVYIGAVPVLADCHPKTFLLTAETIMARITHKTRAIILPHMFGLPADMDEILDLGLPVVEDISQAMGARYKGYKTGGFTDVAVTSFYATKMMTTGTGGMVLSDDLKLLKKVRDLNGIDKKNDLNLHLPYLMNDIQAGIGRCQLKKLDRFIARRRNLASHLNKVLSSLPVEPPSDLPSRRHVFFRYCLKLDMPIAPVVHFFHSRGIKAERPIMSPLHLLDPKGPMNNRKDFINTEEAWNKTISLPIYPSLNEEEIQREAQLLEEALYASTYD